MTTDTQEHNHELEANTLFNNCPACMELYLANDEVKRRKLEERVEKLEHEECKQEQQWEEELNEYNFCCGGDYCDLTHDADTRQEMRRFIRTLLAKRDVIGHQYMDGVLIIGYCARCDRYYHAGEQGLHERSESHEQKLDALLGEERTT